MRRSPSPRDPLAAQIEPQESSPEEPEPLHSGGRQALDAGCAGFVRGLDFGRAQRPIVDLKLVDPSREVKGVDRLELLDSDRDDIVRTGRGDVTDPAPVVEPHDDV
jgi:hypothetical protein